MKAAVFLLFLCFVCYGSYGQQTNVDSLKTAKIAVTDADKYLKINRTIRKAYRQKMLSITSDYFKPTPQTTSNVKFLADSNYVKVYRHTALESTAYQIQLNRSKVIIIGLIVAGTVVTVVIVVKLAEAFGNAVASIFGGIK